MTLKYLYSFSYFVIFCAFVIMGVVIYWMIYPYKTVEFLDPVFPIHNTQVKQGELVYYTARYCKYNTLPAVVTRSFVNNLIYVTPSTTTNRPTGCNTLIFGILIPKELPAGGYYMEQTYKIQVNPIRTVVIKQNSDTFEVIASE